MEWHFERLSDAEKVRVRQLFEQKKYSVLRDYYKIKKVFTGSFCSICKAGKVVKEWTQWAINEQKI